MKKLMIVTHKMSGGGCERVIAQLLTCFARDGIECKLVTECGVPSFYDLPESVEQIYLTFDQTLPARRIPKAYRKLRKLVKQEKPDIVLAMPEKVRSPISHGRAPPNTRAPSGAAGVPIASTQVGLTSGRMRQESSAPQVLPVSGLRYAGLSPVAGFLLL